MCGILAIARSRPRPDGGPVATPRAVAGAMARLRRRGPDGEGLWESPCRRVVLGHARLAVQDLSDAGRQPMADLAARDGSSTEPGIIITYNGEIYNGPGLRRELEGAGAEFRSCTDTEVFIHGCRQWGLRALLDKLRGMYAFVLIDRRDPARPVLHAAVDHAGMKPLVYAYSQRHGRMVIASDCDAVLAGLADEADFVRRVDGTGLAHVLSIGYCPAPGTVWRGLNKLGPGECLTWEVATESGPRIERHWSPPEVLGDGAGGDEQDHFEDLLGSVVSEHLLSDVPVGLFLSAGLDSSSIALALHGMRHHTGVSAYTLSAAGIDAAQDEAADAGALARGLGMPHRVVPFEPGSLARSMANAADAFDEPQGFTALLTAAEIARSVRRGRSGDPTVILGGDGGDEALGGYAWHRRERHPLALHAADGGDSAPATRELSDPRTDPAARDAARLQLARHSYTHRYLCRLFAGFHPAESRAMLASLEPEYDERVFANWLAPEDRAGLPHPRRAQRLDMFGFCAGSILPKLDRSAMHVGLELRSPFLDRRALDWCLARPVAEGDTAHTPSKSELRTIIQRGIHAGLAPAGLLTRPKQGFSLRLPETQPFHRLAAEMLPASRLVRDGVIRRDYSAFLPGSVEAREQRLFTLCMVAAWYERRAGA